MTAELPDIWVQTYSGKPFSLLRPNPLDVHLTDIAQSLAMQCRFNGATKTFYSVAQHSTIVSSLVPAYAKPYALLHDAHEAYIGDISTPLKDALSRVRGLTGLDKITRRIDKAIFEAFGLTYPMPPSIERVVRQADLVALATEKRDLLQPAARDWNYALPHPAKRVIVPKAWPVALEGFIQEFVKLCELHPKMNIAIGKYAALRERRTTTQS